MDELEELMERVKRRRKPSSARCSTSAKILRGLLKALLPTRLRDSLMKLYERRKKLLEKREWIRRHTRHNATASGWGPTPPPTHPAV
ncbi:MAG: hypothetical protein Q4E43_01635 [Akkermansia sp.]|nr:hypothetical protein [Akkermansia sp.]